MFGDLRAWALLPLAAPLVLQNLPPWPRLSQRDAGLDNINGAHHVLDTSQRPPHTKELPGTLVVIPHGGVFARARPGTASRTPSLLRPAAPTVRASAAAVPLRTLPGNAKHQSRRGARERGRHGRGRQPGGEFTVAGGVAESACSFVMRLSARFLSGPDMDPAVQQWTKQSSRF